MEPAPGGVAIDTPETITDNVSKLGWLAGVYVQDEWKVTHNFTINAGLRFDQMWQYVDANQLSPRINFTYKPFENTTFHAGYARYFTPPEQVLGRSVPIGLYTGTTNQADPAITNVGAIRPERADVYDAGIIQEVLPQCRDAPADAGTMPAMALVAPLMFQAGDGVPSGAQ